MMDPLATVSLLVVSLFGSLDAFLLLRDLPAKVRVRRLHHRNRRWVRALPVRPAHPDPAGRAGTLAAAGMTVTTCTHPVMPAASIPEGHQL